MRNIYYLAYLYNLGKLEINSKILLIYLLI